MLSKSAAKKFFLIGTVVCSGCFVLLTVDTVQKVPQQSHAENITPEVIHGKDLWDHNNCMGCHTIMGEGAYYAPELTKVYERRGPIFIKSMLKDPQAMFPGQRNMQKYNFTETEIDSLVAFLKWIGEVDLNGFPKKPDLVPAAPTANTAQLSELPLPTKPAVFDQVCVACHALQGKGGAVGPVLDGVGNRRNHDFLVSWLKDPLAVKADSKMPKLPLTDEQVQELANFLSQLK
ncbi:c-type cytochrome [Bdellovibrio svalbardensis]|uniref:Cytochrome c n=1 Tax=Bdellovibrio svalbardensis TaxID=2972972 RepID=A0ABT6DJ97_9BACT|nr:cytochrome c [Bdellovibrio svalbardensis]MDG0816937.1 cytochrome c [Bdellovibrio svalbardensis]